MRRLELLFVGMLLLTCAIASAQTKSDVWEPFKFFVGSWEGVGTGKPGTAKVQRDYSFALNNKFLQVKNKSSYDPQPQNPKGEIHEDWGMISFDKARKQFVFRQFHVEGFVNHYVVTASDGKTIVFTSEHLENIPAGYKARETYRILNENEFEESFEVAEPNKEFVVYSTNRLKRKL